MHHFFTSLLQVMSPSERVVGEPKQSMPNVAVGDPNRVNNDHLEEKSAVPDAALGKVLAMLGDLSDRLNRMEVS